MRTRGRELLPRPVMFLVPQCSTQQLTWRTLEWWAELKNGEFEDEYEQRHRFSGQFDSATHLTSQRSLTLSNCVHDAGDH